MKTERSLASRAQVDLIPMIDVVFQLILFFLVSTTFAVMPAITLNLPQSGTAQAADVKSITITATANGSLWFNEAPVTFEQLDEKLATSEIETKERLSYPIRFEADEMVTNGTIVKVFDVLRKNGFAAVNLRTTDEK